MLKVRIITENNAKEYAAKHDGSVHIDGSETPETDTFEIRKALRDGRQVVYIGN